MRSYHFTHFSKSLHLLPKDNALCCRALTTAISTFTAVPQVTAILALYLALNMKFYNFSYQSIYKINATIIINLFIINKTFKNITVATHIVTNVNVITISSLPSCKTLIYFFQFIKTEHCC